MEEKMKTQKLYIYLLIITLIVGILTSGCDFSSKIKIGDVRLGMFGDNEIGYLSYSYRTFTGVESNKVSVQNGDTLAFSYQVSVNKGSLNIEWQDPDGEIVWQEIFTTDAQGDIEIPMGTAGSYKIIIQGKDTGGSFEISWHVK